MIIGVGLTESLTKFPLSQSVLNLPPLRRILHVSPIVAVVGLIDILNALVAGRARILLSGSPGHLEQGQA